jgi:hypothetical protein
MASYGGDNDQARVSPLEVKRKPRVNPNKTGVASIVKRLMKATARVGVNIEHPEADKYKAAASQRNTDKVGVHTPDEVKPTQRPKIVDEGKEEDLYGTGTQFTNPVLPDKALKANVKKGDDSDEDFQLGVGRESVAHGKQSTPPRATNLVARLKKAVSGEDKDAWSHIRDHAKKNGHSESKARDTFSNWKKSGKPFEPTTPKKPFDDSTVNWRVTDVDEKEPEPDRAKQWKDDLARTNRERAKTGEVKYKIHKWGENKEADESRQEKIDAHAAKTKAKVKWRNEEEKRLKNEAGQRVRNKGGSAEAEQNARDSARVRIEQPDTPEGPRINRDNQLRLKRRGKTGKALDDVDNKERNTQRALGNTEWKPPSREESPHAKRRLDAMSAKDTKEEAHINRLKKAINQDLLDVLLGKAKYKDDPEGWAKGKKLNLTHAESVSSTGKLEADTKLANHLETLQSRRGKPKSLPGKAVKDAVQDEQLDMFADEGKGENISHGDDIKEPVQRGGSKKGSKAQKLIPPRDWKPDIQNAVTEYINKATMGPSYGESRRDQMYRDQNENWEEGARRKERPAFQGQPASPPSPPNNGGQKPRQPRERPFKKSMQKAVTSTTGRADRTGKESSDILWGHVRKPKSIDWKRGSDKYKNKDRESINPNKPVQKAREQGDGLGVEPSGKNPSKKLDTRDNLQVLANLNTDLAKELEATYTVNGEALNKEEWNLHNIQEARLSAARTHAMHLAMKTNCDCPSIEAEQIEVRKNHAFPLTTAEKPGMVMRGEPSAMYSADGKALEEDPMARKIDIRDKNDSKLEANERTVKTTQDSKGRITTVVKGLPTYEKNKEKLDNIAAKGALDPKHNPAIEQAGKRRGVEATMEVFEKGEPTICSSLAVFNSILNKTEYDDKVVARQGKSKRSKRNSITNSTVDTAAQQINDTRGI